MPPDAAAGAGRPGLGSSSARGAGGLCRMTIAAYSPLIRASTSATSAFRAAISVAPVAVMASRCACRPRGRRSTAATCQSATSPWYEHGPTAQPGIFAMASWTAAHARSRSSSVTDLACATRRARLRTRRSRWSPQPVRATSEDGASSPLLRQLAEGRPRTNITRVVPQHPLLLIGSQPAPQSSP